VLAGGGHVRRRSVGAAFQASPCIRFEKKRKHVNEQEIALPLAYDDAVKDSPNKARIITMPSIMSTSSSKFGGERMIKAQHGLLARESLEESCLVAEGEDLTSRE
jgi:serine/arginine repetitive matrix protein 2